MMAFIDLVICFMIFFLWSIFIHGTVTPLDVGCLYTYEKDDMFKQQPYLSFIRLGICWCHHSFCFHLDANAI